MSENSRRPRCRSQNMGFRGFLRRSGARRLADAVHDIIPLESVDISLKWTRAC